MKSFWQRFGKALLMPISTLAAAGLFLGIAAALQNSAIVGEQFVKLDTVQNLIGLIRRLAGLLFGNLPLFFALSIGLGMVDEEKPTAAYSAVLGFLVFHLTINYILGLNEINAQTTTVQYLTKNAHMNQIQASIENARYEFVLGFFTYRMNAFAGIIVGLIVAQLHNRFHTIQLPHAINFFGGKRFVPIVTVVTIPVVAIVSYFIWPYFDKLIAGLGSYIGKAGEFGPFVFGMLNRLLIPTGLHHILNQLVRFTPIGGTAMINGEQLNGALNIYSAALAAKEAVPLDIFQLGTRFIGQGHMVIVMFGLPAAVLAIINNANEKNKVRVKALMYAAGAASFVTGITEPIEFAFLFIAPMLFLFHAVMTGLSYMIMALLKVSVGYIQGGVIDFIIFGVFRGLETKWYVIPVAGLVFAAMYYKVFDYAIRQFDLKTPGRDDEEFSEHVEAVAVKPAINLPGNAVAETIVAGLGGAENIKEVENCFTRLRVHLADGNKVDENMLRQTHPSGIIRPERDHIQIVYGLKVESIYHEVAKLL